MSERLTESDIDSRRSPQGGWTRATLAEWGVPWPPPKGWRKALLAHGAPYHPEEKGAVDDVDFSLCEWDPDADAPASSLDGGVDYIGCGNPATVSLGTDGRWHLCDSCAALPRFNRFRARRALQGDQQ